MAIKEYQIEKIKIKDLKFDKANPNEMTDAEMKALEYQMEQEGFLEVVLVDQDNNMIDGEHRARVYKKRGIEEIQCFRVQVRDEAHRRLLRQAMNKVRGHHNPAKDAEEYRFIIANSQAGVENLKMILGKTDEQMTELRNFLQNNQDAEAVKDSLFRIENTPFEAAPPGLESHQAPPDISGEVHCGERPYLTFVFDSETARNETQEYFCAGEQSKVPKGEKLWGFVQDMKKLKGAK